MKKKNYLSAILLIAVLTILPVLSWALPYKSHSENENRDLASFPQVSVRTISNKKFMKNFEDFISDHFAFRDGWITFKSNLEYLTGMRETNGIYIGKDRLYEKIEEPSELDTDKKIQAIISFTEKSGKAPYLMLVPTSLGVVGDSLPKYVETWDQKAYIESVYQKLSSNVIRISAYKELYNHSDSYIYYRTDHHWTTYGAMLAYEAAAGVMDLSLPDYTCYDVSVVSQSFNGTLSSKCGYRKINPDNIERFTPVSGGYDCLLSIFDGNEWSVHTGLYYDEYLDQKDKYSYFTGTVQPIVKISKESGGDRKILVFKDSFAHCFVPFLLNDYDEITMVDLRYMNEPFDTYVDIEDYEDIMLLYNINTFCQSDDVMRLDWID